MSIILNIETATKNCSVALAKEGKTIAYKEIAEQNFSHAEKLHVFIEELLAENQLQFSDLSAIAVSQGPGSYTGLRIGASSAKGFCFGLQIPLVAVNSLETMIQPFLNKEYDFIISMIDARRMEVYCAVFDGKSGEILAETEAKILEETSFHQFEGKKVIFVGDGAIKAKEILQISNADFDGTIFPSAKYLIEKAVAKFEKKEFEDVAYFEPFYLKDFQGVKKKKSQ